MTEPTFQEVPLPPVKVAFVIDGEVVDVIHTDERLAAILLSAPIIVDVTETAPANRSIVGWNYDGTTFTDPNPTELLPGDTTITYQIIEDAPAEEAPVAEAPVEEAPIAETPIEETPVEEAPIDETPVEETPIEEDAEPQS